MKIEESFTVPYVSSISNNFKGIVRNIKYKLAFYSTNKLRSFIKVYKDPLPITSNKNVVYKIFCNDCDALYVKQTGRQLRIKNFEHRKHINKNINAHYKLQCNYNI